MNLPLKKGSRTPEEGWKKAEELFQKYFTDKN